MNPKRIIDLDPKTQVSVRCDKDAIGRTAEQLIAIGEGRLYAKPAHDGFGGYIAEVAGWVFDRIVNKS